MPEEERLSKKQLKELRKLAELDSEKSEKKQNTFKWIAIIASSLLFLGFFAWIVMASKEQKTETDIANISTKGWVRGADTAKVTLTEFSDLQCPACKSYEPQIQTLLKDYDGKLKLLYKHYPLSGHKNAVPASMASEAAGAQGKFWEMHDKLFEAQEEWSVASNPDELLISYATELELDIDKFTKDLDSKELEEKIREQSNEGAVLGVSATPTFYLNGRKLGPLRTYDDFKKEVDAELENVAK